jgi:hypothetical protein
MVEPGALTVPPARIDSDPRSPLPTVRPPRLVPPVMFQAELVPVTVTLLPVAPDKVAMLPERLVTVPPF